NSIIAEPNNPDILLVSSPGGGVYITENNGDSWKRIVTGNPYVTHLEWDLDGSGRVFGITASAMYRLDTYSGLNLHFVKCAGFSLQPPPLYKFDTRVDNPKP